MGIPGTGLSYRTSLQEAGNRHSGPTSTQSAPLFPSPRAAARQARQNTRDAERMAAVGLQADREARLNALRGILHDREREPIVWEVEYASQGPYQPRPFAPEMPTLSKQTIRAEVERMNPISPWAGLVVACVLGLAIAPQLWFRVPVLVVGLYCMGQCAWLVQARRKEARRVLQERQAQQAAALSAAKAAHDAEEAQRAVRHEQEEHLRERLRSAVVNDDVEVAASVLEVELSNEDLPIAIAYEAEFDGLENLALRVELPPLDEIPLTKSQVTKAGTFSERPMAKRDRVGLYEDVCASLILRLVHEVFRVLPFTNKVNLTGTASRVSPVTGHPETYLALRFPTTRGRFQAVILDGIDPSLGLQGLAAEYTLSREGEFKALEDQGG